MDSGRQTQLIKLRDEYISLLGDTFHMTNPEEMARERLFSMGYMRLIDDYLNLVCTPHYKELVHQASKNLQKSQLEKTASEQTQPSCTGANEK